MSEDKEPSTIDELTTALGSIFDGKGKIPLGLISNNPPIIDPNSLVHIIMSLLAAVHSVAQALPEEQQAKVLEYLNGRKQDMLKKQSSIVLPKGGI